MVHWDGGGDGALGWWDGGVLRWWGDGVLGWWG